MTQARHANQHSHKLTKYQQKYDFFLSYEFFVVYTKSLKDYVSPSVITHVLINSILSFDAEWRKHKGAQRVFSLRLKQISLSKFAEKSFRSILCADSWNGSFHFFLSFISVEIAKQIDFLKDSYNILISSLRNKVLLFSENNNALRCTKCISKGVSSFS